jgi:MFS family permease
MGLGWPIASGLSARLLPKVGFRRLLRTGLLLVFCGCLLTATAAYLDFHFVFLMLGMGMLGLGMGFSNIPLLFSVQASVSWNRRGSATASTLFFRTVGGTISVGVMGALLARAIRRDPLLPPGLANILIGPSHGAGVSEELLDRLSRVMDWGLYRIFFCSAGIALIALVCGLFFPDVGKEPKGDEEIEGI